MSKATLVEFYNGPSCAGHVLKETSVTVGPCTAGSYCSMRVQPRFLFKLSVVCSTGGTVTKAVDAVHLASSICSSFTPSGGLLVSQEGSALHQGPVPENPHHMRGCECSVQLPHRQLWSRALPEGGGSPQTQGHRQIIPVYRASPAFLPSVGDGVLTLVSMWRAAGMAVI